MQEVKIKTHLIIKDIHSEYDVNWCGRLVNVTPKLENGLPVFVIIGSDARVELNTIDMRRIEDCAKRLTNPKGRQAVTTDTARIYVKEADGNEVLMGVVTHRKVKTFAPMYDKVGYML